MPGWSVGLIAPIASGIGAAQVIGPVSGGEHGHLSTLGAFEALQRGQIQPVVIEPPRKRTPARCTELSSRKQA